MNRLGEYLQRRRPTDEISVVSKAAPRSIDTTSVNAATQAVPVELDHISTVSSLRNRVLLAGGALTGAALLLVAAGPDTASASADKAAARGPASCSGVHQERAVWIHTRLGEDGWPDKTMPWQLSSNFGKKPVRESFYDPVTLSDGLPFSSGTPYTYSFFSKTPPCDSVEVEWVNDRTGFPWTSYPHMQVTKTEQFPIKYDKNGIPRRVGHANLTTSEMVFKPVTLKKVEGTDGTYVPVPSR